MHEWGSLYFASGEVSVKTVELEDESTDLAEMKIAEMKMGGKRGREAATPKAILAQALVSECLIWTDLKKLPLWGTHLGKPLLL